MGLWINTQVRNYKNKCEILGITETLQKLWVSFITDNKKIFSVIYKKLYGA